MQTNTGVNVCVACFNVFQIKPSNDIDLTSWMSSDVDHASISIYFFSLQEVMRVDNVSKVFHLSLSFNTSD